MSAEADSVAVVDAAVDLPPPESLPRLADLAWVLALTCLVTALNVAWAMQNQAPPSSDDNTHLFTSVRMLHQVPSSRGPLSLLLLYPGHYPPLTYQVTYGFYRLFGEAPWVAIASFFPFLLTMALSMYGVGAWLGNRWTGLLCALASLCAPVVLDHARAYFVDLPATAALAFSLCAALYSRGFRSRPWSLAFGVSMAMGLLSKWTHPALVVPFLLVAMYKALAALYAERWPGMVVVALMAGTVYVMARHVLATPSPIAVSDFTEGPPFHWMQWCMAAALTGAALLGLRRAARTRPNLVALTNMLEAFALSVLLAWPWYYANGERVREKITYQAGVQVDFWQGVAAYIQDISVMLYNAPLLIAIGVTVGLALHRTRAWTALLALSVALGIGLNAMLPPDARYIMPTVVFVAPLALAWIAHAPVLFDLPRRRPAQIACQGVAAIIAMTCLWQASAFLFAFGEGPRRIDARRDRMHLGVEPVLPVSPKPGVYPYNEVLDAIQTGDPSEHPWVAVLETREDAATFQPRTFLYHAARRSLDLFLVETADDIEAGRSVRDIEQVRTFLLIYRLESDRARLREGAAERHWIPSDARPSKTFTFTPAFRVEIYPREHPPSDERDAAAGTR